MTERYASIHRRSQEVGFGRGGDRGKVGRLLNRDGTFNFEKKGINAFQSLSLYHLLVTTTWPRFLLSLIALYTVSNVIFALGYLACGEGSLVGVDASSLGGRFSDCFFFSVQTLATIGYGVIHPHGVAPNLLVTIESMTGLLEFALMTGLFFARFSRPNAKIEFSKHAVIAPYRDQPSLQFRLLNLRKSQLLEPHVWVVLVD